MNENLLPEISEESLAAILELISDGIWDWNVDTGYVYRSPGWYRMLGYDVNTLENTVFTWESVIHPDDFKRVMKHFDDYITNKSPVYKIQYRCRTKDGNYLWIEDRGRIVEWHEDSSVARMIGAHRDINAEKELQRKSELKNLTLQEMVDERSRDLIEANKQLKAKISEAERFATTDSLTSLSNRYYFEQKLKTECARAKRFHEPLSLIALDLDNFKQVNDLYGHLTGDLILIKAADIIRTHTREIDVLVRWGGDEFMILLPNTSIEQAKILAEKIRLLMEQDSKFHESLVTGSFGVTQFDNEEAPMRFTIRADNALYESKNAGRNQVTTLGKNEVSGN